jgi:hypothetical protein
MKNSNPLPDNRSTRLYATIQGSFVGLAAMIHGVTEILQGNRPTEGLLLEDVGAFTLIPNYLVTGIAATLLGLFILVWAIRYIHTRHGATVFLLLSIASFLVGGGIGEIVLFLIVWGVATRIHSRLPFWRRVLPTPLKKWLAGSWAWIFAAGYFFLFIGVLIWLVFTPPWMAYEAKSPAMLYACWASLLIGLFLQILAIISGFARDIQRQDG